MYLPFASVVAVPEITPEVDKIIVIPGIPVPR
jgi:hypothetical protein